MSQLSMSQFKNFTQFVDRFVLPGREGLEQFNPDALKALSGADRDEVIALLCSELQAGTNDPRVATALEELHALEALPLLKQASQHTDQAAVAAALALWNLAQDPSVEQALASVLRNSNDPSARLMAAGDLERFPSAMTEQALLAALDDADELVRGQATATLMKHCGLSAFSGNPNSRLFCLTALVLNPLRAVREPAIRSIADLIAKLHAGADAASLGLNATEETRSEALAQFSASVFEQEDPWSEDFDLASLDRLQGEERPWAQHLIYLQLAEGDVRAVRALLHVGDPNCVAALREVAAMEDSEIAEAARNAADQIIL
jgi:hypothetical protein